MKIIAFIATAVWFAIFFSRLGYADDSASQATLLLKKRNAEFSKEIIQVADNVYTAVGYGVSPVIMIVGRQGLVIVDTGIDAGLGGEIREDLRAITDKAVKAIVLTHGHGDHTGGVSAFMDSADVQIWAREGVGVESRFGAESTYQ